LNEASNILATPCLQRVELINYLNGKLNADAMRTVEEHFSECDLCSHAIDVLYEMPQSEREALLMPANNPYTHVARTEHKLRFTKAHKQTMFAAVAGLAMLLGTVFIYLAFNRTTDKQIARNAEATPAEEVAATEAVDAAISVPVQMDSTIIANAETGPKPGTYTIDVQDANGATKVPESKVPNKVLIEKAPSIDEPKIAQSNKTESATVSGNASNTYLWKQDEKQNDAALNKGTVSESASPAPAAKPAANTTLAEESANLDGLTSNSSTRSASESKDKAPKVVLKKEKVTINNKKVLEMDALATKINLNKEYANRLDDIINLANFYKSIDQDAKLINLYTTELAYYKNKQDKKAVEMLQTVIGPLLKQN
jgi:hypothetical protein